MNKSEGIFHANRYHGERLSHSDTHFANVNSRDEEVWWLEIPIEKISSVQTLEISRLAQSEGVEETKLVRKWVREKLRTFSFKRPPNKALQSSAQKKRRG